MALYYFDTSALVKLVRTESDSTAMYALWADVHGSAISSELVVTELQRAVRHEPAPVRQQAMTLLDQLALIAVDRPLLEQAGRLDPGILRSLDAIHTASALAVGQDLAALVTYDARMADAARLHNIPLLSPT